MQAASTRAPLVDFQPGEYGHQYQATGLDSSHAYDQSYRSDLYDSAPSTYQRSQATNASTNAPSATHAAAVNPSPAPIPPHVVSIRIPRDYSEGEIRQFALEFPTQFEGRIEVQDFRQFIRRLNSLLAEAEAPLVRHAVDHILAFFTLNLSSLVIPSYYDRAMKRVNEFIADENERLFIPHGFRVTDPHETAFLYLEFVPLAPTS
ncbi:hypothetical protein IWQ60_000742 [Tieghemiomyces parasiticus]|uniref:Ras modification protein ERF4 n=1 Tax=Tieghemiomyces parasiticus TaxID=78921 RepID=A0A9W8AL55_9FUNG|nr:hypothetical protein IWQ60_000742 [Tieghemiomyces parasiticus]